MRTTPVYLIGIDPNGKIARAATQALDADQSPVKNF
jgi:hypothetical protein